MVPPLDDMTRRAFAIVRAAVETAAIPGAVLGAVDARGARVVLFAGQAQTFPVRVPLTATTWFDLASLTKVLFTTVQILVEAARGRIDLDAPLTELLPELAHNRSGGWLGQISFRDCLGHQTRFPAVEPFHLCGRDPVSLRALILDHRWTPGPPVYSDINFILLGLALERLRGMQVARMDPGWGLSFAPPADKCAATENCPWRGRVLRGEIHDENAFALGGAGHAGLFGTMDGVLDFARDLLTGSGFAAETVARMREPVSPERTLGWERPYPGWSGGDACNATVIGHTGFTGTGLWVDFRRGLAWALLTNRVHPSRARDSGIQGLRRAVGDVFSAGG